MSKRGMLLRAHADLAEVPGGYEISLRIGGLTIQRGRDKDVPFKTKAEALAYYSKALYELKQAEPRVVLTQKEGDMFPPYRAPSDCVHPKCIKDDDNGKLWCLTCSSDVTSFFKAGVN